MANNIDIYLLDIASGDSLYLPVNPEEIQIRRDKHFETVNIIRLGEVDLCGRGQKIQEVSFSSFFPAVYDSSYCNYPDIPKPAEAMKLLDTWTRDRVLMQLLITGDILNMHPAVISASTATHCGGEPGDIYFELTCRAWRDVQVRTKAEAAGAAAGKRADIKPVPKVYTVKKGDRLDTIAKRELGKAARWKEIYKLNKATIGKDYTKLFVGQKLVMPK
jgi:hypothetical protein